MTVEQEILQVFSDKKIYLYGAGKIGRSVAWYLLHAGMDVKGVIVSDIANNVPIEGLPLYDIDSFQLPEDAYIVLAVGKKFYLEILDLLLKKGFQNIIQIPDKQKQWMHQCQLEHAYADCANGYGISFSRPYSEAGMGIIYDEKTDEALFRVIEYQEETKAEQVAQVCTRENFEALYGPLRILPHKEQETESDFETENVEIYVATSHFDQMSFVKREGMFAPLQVGAALTGKRKGCQTDNEGDHISGENANYCECTGLYWVWKNTSGQDYVGLNHYRRRLELSTEDMAFVKAQGCDMVLALPQYGSMKVKNFFAGRLITKLDWDLMCQFVCAYDTGYDAVIQKYEAGDIYISCNLFVAKREWFDRYCTFAFSVAKQIDDYYKQRNIIRNDRYMGYIFENLLSMFVMRYYDKMKILFTTVKWIG